MIRTDLGQYMDIFDLYIHNSLESGIRVFDKTTAIYQIRLNYPDMVFPKEFSENLFNTFNMYKATTKLNEIEDKDMKPYCKYILGDVKAEGTKWIVNLEQTIDPFKLEHAWKGKREERNRLLLETDWISNSNLSLEIKEKYEIYRQLLRDCINIATYPHEVVFPELPKIHDSNTISRRQISSEEVEKLKDYKTNLPGWTDFLRDWQKYNFTTDYYFVRNLIKLNCDPDISLDTILT